MTFAMFLRTVFEVLLFAALVWGLFHEDRLAAFEERLFCHLRRKKLRVAKPDFSSERYARN